jgi:hypothetical protein
MNTLCTSGMFRLGPGFVKCYERWRFFFAVKHSDSDQEAWITKDVQDKVLVFYLNYHLEESQKLSKQGYFSSVKISTVEIICVLKFNEYIMHMRHEFLRTLWKDIGFGHIIFEVVLKLSSDYSKVTWIILLFAWNYFDSIMTKLRKLSFSWNSNIKSFRSRMSKYGGISTDLHIIPFPTA